MDVEVEKRLEKLERVYNEDAKLNRIERTTFRVGGFVLASLTILLVILAKVVDVVHTASSILQALTG